MEYIYVFTLLISIPLVWNILYSLRFENLFKSGRVWQIKAEYIIVTLIISHLLADMLNTFINSFYSEMEKTSISMQDRADIDSFINQLKMIVQTHETSVINEYIAELEKKPNILYSNKQRDDFNDFISRWDFKIQSKK